MTDPFWMMTVLHNVEPGHIVWDKAGEIDLKKPGRGTLSCHFKLDEVKIEELKKRVLEHGKATMWFVVDIVDETGETVSTVRKEVYVRTKKPAPASLWRFWNRLLDFSYLAPPGGPRISNTVKTTATNTIPTTAESHGRRSAKAWIFSIMPFGSSPPGAKRQESLSRPRRRVARSKGTVAKGMIVDARPKMPRETLQRSLAHTKSVTKP